MNMKKTPLTLSLLIASFASANAASLVINGNWCSVVNIANPPSGVNASGPWTDLTNVGGFLSVDTFGSFNFANGGPAATGFSASWIAGSQDGHDQRGETGFEITNGFEELYGGYLQTQDPNPGTGNGGTSLITFNGSGVLDAITSTGVTTDRYDLYLYIDGEDASSGPTGIESGEYTASLTGGTTTDGTPTTYYGLDDSDFIALMDGGVTDFAQVTSTTFGTNASGNYVKFSDITSNDFTAQISGDDIGVSLNGFEIVAVPEPSSSLVLGGLLALSVLPVRRRK
jgi:hypothetical protein